MDSLIDTNTETTREKRLVRLDKIRSKRAAQINVKYIVDSAEIHSIDQDDGLTIPDFRKTLQK